MTINVTGDCNGTCGAECRVSDIRKENRGDRISFPALQGMKSILETFKKTGGYTVCIMAYGEPTVGENFKLLTTIAQITGKLNLFLIINTNGVKLPFAYINILEYANPNIVFQVSYNSSPNSDENDFKRKEDWKEFIKKNQKQITIDNTAYNLSRFVLHTYVTPFNADKMPAIKNFANEL